MPTPALTAVGLFLFAMAAIFAAPYAIWRLGRTDYWAPLAAVQIVTGILLEPGLFGAAGAGAAGADSAGAACGWGSSLRPNRNRAMSRWSPTMRQPAAGRDRPPRPSRIAPRMPATKVGESWLP